MFSATRASVSVEAVDRPQREASLSEEARAIATDAEAARAAAFQRLVDERLDATYRLARLILRDAQEAQDATHDAFVRAWREHHRLRDPEKFDAWFGPSPSAIASSERLAASTPISAPPSSFASTATSRWSRLRARLAHP